MDSIYDHFGFGANIKRWLNLLGTGRQACIALNDHKLTQYFNLETGTAQGDVISAFTFILGYQILLFKINYDLQIDSLVEPPDIQPCNYPHLPAHPLNQQVITTPQKVFALADDATVLTMMNFESLRRLFDILTDFALISGLTCNKDKTILMPIGQRIPIDERIVDMGLEIKN